VVLCGTVCKAACTGWGMPAAQQPQRTIKDTMIEQLGGCIPFGVWLVCVCGGVVCKRMKTVKKKVEEREKKKKNGNGTTKKQSKERKTENLNPYSFRNGRCVRCVGVLISFAWFFLLGLISSIFFLLNCVVCVILGFTLVVALNLLRRRRLESHPTS